MRAFAMTLTAGLMLLASCQSARYADLGDGIFADIQTNEGDIIVSLEYEKVPVTVANFVSLAEGTNPFVDEEFKNKKYYDGLTFHRVMKDFMIQGGDPTASGTGGPGYRFADEFNDSLRHSKAGILSMANAGPKTNGSQFFITHKPTPWLDQKHSVFGEVVAGMEVVDSIANVKTGEANKPVEAVVMEEVKIIRNGKEAKDFDAVQVLSDYFAREEAAAAALEKHKTDFINTIAKQRAEADTLPSGLMVYELETGDGPKPRIGQQVMVDYAGWLLNGELFDTSMEEEAKAFGRYDDIKRMHRGSLEPVPMTYSTEARLIAGFREGLLRLKVGDKVRLFIPPHLGYGAQGSGPIPPNADLIFDIHIVDMAQ